MSDDLIKAEVLMVAKELAGLGDGSIQPVIASTGMCYHVYETFGTARHNSQLDFYTEIFYKIDDITESWPEYSGSMCYPVPDLAETNPAKAKYAAKFVYKYTSNLWGDTPYGDLRREYCTYLAVELIKFANEKLSEEL